MNLPHRIFCRSNRWRQTIRQRVSWAVHSVDLGREVLEIGPGPGLATELLQSATPRLTALEIDVALSQALHSRLASSHLEVVTGDATAMPFPDAGFSGCAAFTMLHHVPSEELQDRLFREVWRVLKPGGFFVGADSLPSLFMRLIHIGDTMVLVDPETLSTRLEASGFEVLALEKDARAFRFCARRPQE